MRHCSWVKQEEYGKSLNITGRVDQEVGWGQEADHKLT